MSSVLEDFSVVPGYQNLLSRVEEIRKQDVGLDAVKNIRDAMDDAEKLVENVSKPREIGLDARVLELTSVVVQQNAEKIDSVFRSLEFADKLVNLLSSKSYETQSEASIWTQFAADFGYLLPLCPHFDYINGTYDRAGFKPKERAPRQCHRRKDYVKEVVKTLSEKGLGKNDQALGQQDILDKIAKLIGKSHKTNGNKPLNFFEVILNPNSFEETCQNILNVAFLVRDSLLKMFMDDGELVMVPCKPKRDDMGGLQKEESKRQFVIQIDRNDWKELVQAYHVTEPVINFGLCSQKCSWDKYMN